MSTLAEFSKNLFKFHILKAGSGDEEYHSIESLCAIAMKYFKEELKKVDEREFGKTRLSGKTLKEKKTKLQKWIGGIMGDINKCVKDESDNDLRAPEDLYELLFDKDSGLPKYQHMTCKIAARTDFYRVRSAEKYEVFDRKGMFLLSDKLENLTGSYRFNPSGYACLYLASNLYLAWEECRRPDFDTVNFSRFQNMDELEVLDLTIRQELLYKDQFLLAYLTLLCTAKTTDKDKHNFQYVVPQMLMKVLCLSQRKMEKMGKAPIAGIKYLSSRRYNQKDFLFDDISLTEAYVFPQRPHDDKHEICPFLARTFNLTMPRTYFLLKAHRFNFFNRTAYVSDYQDSLFYQMQEVIKKDKLDRYDAKIEI